MLKPSRQSEDREPRLHDSVRIGAEGLAKVLGELEARILSEAWAIGRPATGREVFERVSRDRDVAILTIVTVMNRLVEKRLMVREKRDGLLRYEPSMTEAELHAYAARKVVDGILSFGKAAIAASFVDALAEQDPEQLAELERMVQKRLRGE
jgi:predicted transcriptional regulator